MLAAYSQEGPSGSLGTGRPTSGERATESNGRVVSYYLAPGEKKTANAKKAKHGECSHDVTEETCALVGAQKLRMRVAGPSSCISPGSSFNSAQETPLRFSSTHFACGIVRPWGL